MTLPNFLIIGAQKAGTTLLWDVLNQHPDVYMSQIKEPHYFSFLCENSPALEGDRAVALDLAGYMALFANAGTARAIGEASTSYLHTAGVAEQIQQLLPSSQVICMLRNPVERAYSHYLWLARIGAEDESTFAAALALEQSRREQCVPFGRYVEIGEYHRHLRPYFDLFPRQQLHVCLFEDLVKRPNETYPQIFDFLGIDPQFEGDTSVRRNPSGVPKSRWLNNLISAPNPLRDFIQPRLPRWLYQKITRVRDANLSRPPMGAEIERQLIECFRPDIEALQLLLGRDLSAWLQPGQAKGA